MAISQSELHAVATCCRNGAAMLRLADTNEPDTAKRLRLVSFNLGQAELLIKAAQIADEGADQIAASTVTVFNERASQEVVTLLEAMASGKKIDAIKAYRSLTGYRLKESIDAVERVMNLFAPTPINPRSDQYSVAEVRTP